MPGNISSSLVLSTLLIATIPIGCSSHKIKTWPVGGSVSIDGMPLDRAMIRFHPKNDENGRGASGAVKNGRYLLQTPGGHFEGGAVPGEYIVTFSKLVLPEKRAHDGGFGEAVETLPAYLTDRKESRFTVNVEKKRNHFDFELHSTR